MGTRAGLFSLRIENCIAGAPAISVAIIQRAVLDWEKLMATGAGEGEKNINGTLVSFNELRRYFRSRWCAEIFPVAGELTPERALEILEDRLRRARAKDGGKDTAAAG